MPLLDIKISVMKGLLYALDQLRKIDPYRTVFHTERIKLLMLSRAKTI